MQRDLKNVKEQASDGLPVGPFLGKCCTLDQAPFMVSNGDTLVPGILTCMLITLAKDLIISLGVIEKVKNKRRPADYSVSLESG
ncbi:hypothetical protein IFM89_001266 [Coptis chinensis]|uniref:Uncharacterized protein n=1 Tax=Coptis chinensis TaxID=261450 RepID=A0A835LKW2_9MAGN|nr:hypothetical protein IFM89_001266 [Coptis chinensis]